MISLALLILSAVVVLIFLSFSAAIYRTGFPLDDAWIHQTYARSLAVRGEWAFLPGVPSAGSTSPLWTLLLAPGHFGLMPPLMWTFTLDIFVLAGLALTGALLFRRLTAGQNIAFLAAGAFLALEWHLIWAAASGMETILFAAWILVVLYLLTAEKPRWGWIGFFAGSSAFVRPDGITLLGPALFAAVLLYGRLRDSLTPSAKVLLGFFAGFAPYLLFNRLVAGSWLPNTFYAKQAEYAILQQIPLLERFLSLASLPLIGAGVLLLPGFVYTVWAAVRRRHVVLLALILWWMGYTLLYAVRLPVTYQHGRYLIPAMPVYFVLGLVGFAWLFQRWSARGRLGFLLTRGWTAATVAVLLAFLGVGANQYSQDVAIIETEMVHTAHWIAENTEPGALIAAHDIGAIGYFADRHILDLAGLISPEVIPFIRDETRLAQYLDERGVDYLVTFPGWYPELTRGGDPIYTTHGAFSPAAGGENMTVYRWRFAEP